MLSDVQLFNLVLVREIDEICRKHGIEYYLAGGSVIGVLRHKGFIPWDDDMDLYMTRDNWLRFREAFDEEKPKDRVLESSDINPNYPNMIAKYTSTDTTAIYKNLLSGKYTAGVIVDILILDPVPSDEAIQQKHLKNLLLYSEFVNRYYVFSHRFDINVHFEAALARERLIGHEAIVREYERQVTQYSEEESDTYVLRWGGVPHVFPKDMFGTPKMMPFEGIMLPVPEKSFLYLSQLYGEDWVQLPTIEDELSHEAVFSIDKPYKEFFDEFKPHFDEQGYLDVIMGRKRNRIKAGRSYRRVQDATLEFESRRLMMRYEKLDEARNLRGLYDAGAFDELQELFQEYFKGQCCSRMLGNKYYGGVYRYFHPAYADIGDNLLWIAVELLSRTGKLYHPKRIIEARMFAKGALPSDVQEQKRLIDEMITAIDAFEQGRYDEVVERAEESLRHKPDWINFIKLEILALQRLGGTDTARIRQLAEAGRLVAPDDGDFLKYEGDTYLDEDVERAESLYRAAQDMTRNGATLLAIDEYFQSEVPSWQNAVKASPAGEPDTHGCDETPDEGEARNGWPREEDLSDVQRIHLKLMREVADICDSIHIRYYLAGRTALWAYVNHSVTDGSTSPYLFIHVEDSLKFAEAFEARHPEHRLLDSMLTNNHYPTFSFRYVDTQTLCLATRQLENYRDHGLYVHIGFLEHVPSNNIKRFGSLLKKSWYDMDSLKLSKANLDAQELAQYDVSLDRDDTHVGTTLFHTLVRMYSGTSKRYQTNDAALKYSTFDAELVDGEQAIAEVCGTPFTLFSEPTTYLRQVFGWRIDQAAKKPKEMSPYRIIDTAISYQDYLGRNEDIMRSGAYQRAVLENRTYNKLNLKFSRKINAEWKSALYIDEKWELEKRYEQEAGTIRELYAQGDFDELANILLPYINHIIGLRAKIEPFHNEELCDICTVCLYETKQYDKLERFMKRRRQAMIMDVNKRF